MQRLVLILTLFAAMPLWAGGPTLDDGTLDPEWFGGERAFHRTPVADYFWVRSGFTVEGRTLHFEAWPEPVFIGQKAKKREAEDRLLARQISSEMPSLLELQFGMDFEGVARVSLEEGDLLVSGRIVDCSRGSQAVKLLAPTVAGKGLARIELKFVDKESGEVLAALHTRVTSGTALTNTWNKVVKWVRKFSREVAARGFETVYHRGKPVKD